MPDEDRPFDRQLLQRRMQHLGLHFHSDGPMIWTFTVPVARTIKSNRAILTGDRDIKPRPILARTGIAMNHHDRPSVAFHNEMEVGVVDRYEQRLRALMIVRDTAGKVALLKSTGDFHNQNRDRRITSRNIPRCRQESCLSGGYLRFAGLDDGLRDLVTFFATSAAWLTTARRTVALLPRTARMACRVNKCESPPGTRARTIAWPTRGGMATPLGAKAYSLSHQLGTNLLLKRRRPSKL